MWELIRVRVQSNSLAEWPQDIVPADAVACPPAVACPAPRRRSAELARLQRSERRAHYQGAAVTPLYGGLQNYNFSAVKPSVDDPCGTNYFAAWENKMYVVLCGGVAGRGVSASVAHGASSRAAAAATRRAASAGAAG